jgi:hypothetical protein
MEGGQITVCVTWEDGHRAVLPSSRLTERLDSCQALVRFYEGEAKKKVPMLANMEEVVSPLFGTCPTAWEGAQPASLDPRPSFVISNHPDGTPSLGQQNVSMILGLQPGTELPNGSLLTPSSKRTQRSRAEGEDREAQAAAWRTLLGDRSLPATQAIPEEEEEDSIDAALAKAAAFANDFRLGREEGALCNVVLDQIVRCAGREEGVGPEGLPSQEYEGLMAGVLMNMEKQHGVAMDAYLTFGATGEEGNGEHLDDLSMSSSFRAGGAQQEQQQQQQQQQQDLPEEATPPDGIVPDSQPESSLPPHVSPTPASSQPSPVHSTMHSVVCSEDYQRAINLVGFLAGHLASSPPSEESLKKRERVQQKGCAKAGTAKRPKAAHRPDLPTEYTGAYELPMSTSL